MFKSPLKKALIGFVFLTVCATPALAGVSQIVEDLKPLAGYVVMDMQGEYIVDLDASKGVRVGDIFAAVAAGEKIIHPVTGEVLGTLDQVRAQLRISKVKVGYSYAVPLAGSSKLKAGEAIQRFQGLPAAFWDYSGDGENLYTELKAGLPALEWLDYSGSQAQKPERPQSVPGLEGLVFVLAGNGLTIRDATFQPIRFYSLADLAKQGISIAPAQAAIAAPVAVPSAKAVADSNGATGFVAAGQAAASSSGALKTTAEPDDGVWYGPDMQGEIVAVESVDLDADGKYDLVIAFPHKILLASLTGGQYQGQGFIETPERRRILGVDAADLDNNGKPELYITSLKDDYNTNEEVLASMVADEVDGQWKIIADDIPYLLSRVTLPGEGSTIAAQRLAEKERTYGGKVYKLARNGKKFKAGEELAYDIDKLTVHGFTPFTSGEQQLVALFDINERLEVYDANNQRLWRGSEVMGGSQSYIERVDPNDKSAKLNYYLKARLETRADGTVLVPFNEGTSRAYGSQVFTESRLIAMQWDGRALVEVGVTKPQGGYLADFRVADVDNDGQDEVVMAVVYNQGGGLLSNIRERSALVVYELQ